VYLQEQELIDSAGNGPGGISSSMVRIPDLGRLRAQQVAPTDSNDRWS
jgi:hypothetical protein